MKFEELLARAQSCSDFSGAFFDYAASKKLMPSSNCAKASTDPVTSLISMTTVPSESGSSEVLPSSVPFFTHLLVEVTRVSLHYQTAESALVARYDSCIASLHMYCLTYPPGEVTAAELAVARRSHTHILLEAFIRLSASLIQLENYVVLCYAGFGKALKKHDKLTRELIYNLLLLQCCTAFLITFFPQSPYTPTLSLSK